MKTFTKIISAVACIGLLAGCGYFKPEVETGSDGAPKLSMCEKNATVDDFDDANNQIKVVEGRGEWIYTFKDGFGTEIEFPSGDFRAYPGGVGDSKFVARMRGTTAKSGGDIFAGLGWGLSADGPEVPYDASKYSGISFIAKRGSKDAVSAVRFGIADVNTDPGGGICSECFNHFGSPIKLTDQWTRYVIFFDEMEQRSGWGDPRPDQLDSTGLLGMVFQVSVPNAMFDLMVDDVRFVGACGEVFPGREEKKEVEEAPAPAPAPAAEAVTEEAPADEAEAETEETEAAPADDAAATDEETEAKGQQS